jgi:gamma-glutamyl phosphate reductase
MIDVATTATSNIETMNSNKIEEIASGARISSRKLQNLSSMERDDILLKIASSLADREEEILKGESSGILDLLVILNRL